MQIRDLYKKAHETSDEDYLLRLVDRNLHGVFLKEEVLRVLKIALLCANDNAASRPSITQVVHMLLGTQTIPEHVLNYLLNQNLHLSPPLHDIEMWSDDDYSSILPAKAGRELSHTSGTTVGTTSRSRLDRSLSPVNVTSLEGR